MTSLPIVGVPMVEVSTEPLSCHRDPAHNCSCAWPLRWTRRTAVTDGESAMVRRDSGVVGSAYQPESA